MVLEVWLGESDNTEEAKNRGNRKRRAQTEQDRSEKSAERKVSFRTFVGITKTWKRTVCFYNYKCAPFSWRRVGFRSLAG